jgi:hypothetical protein
MRMRLNEWQRLGIVVSVLWVVCVGAEFWVEKTQGPFSSGWLTNTSVVKTVELSSVLKNTIFRDLVPVDQVVNLIRLLLAVLVPIVGLWGFGFLCARILRGIRNAY